VETHVVPEHAKCAFVPAVPLHAAHAPVQQIPALHPVPSAAFVAPPHVCVPVEHDVVPAWQTLPPGLHPTFAVHATHDPLSQTMFVPHDVPLATLPVELHVGVPVEQLVVPV
jgi:hypothetical protein